MSGENYTEMLKHAMGIDNQSEADEHFVKLVALCVEEGGDPDKAEGIQRANLGYFAGYCSHEVRAQVERLFRCAHPVLGAIDANGPPTSDEVFRAGLEAVKGTR